MTRQSEIVSKTAIILTLSLLLPLCPACAPELPEAWLLPVGDHTLVVEREPYTLRVLDPHGALVIESSGAGSGDGYGSLGWTRGATSWSSLVSPGWFGFEADFEEWRDDWVVVDGETSSAGAQVRLTLELLPAELADDDHEDTAGARVIVTHIVEDGLLRVEASLTGDDAPRAWSAAFRSPEDEAFLGFGERFNRTNQRGVAVYSWAEEGGIGMGEGTIADETNPFPNGEAMTYYPVPYFLSTGGYGFWLDSTWRSQFELATERPDQWRVWHIGPKLAWELYLPSSADTRPWPYQIIDRFTARTGRPMVPPSWAFGPRRRIGRGDVQGGVSEIQAMRDLDLAITAVDDALHFLPRGSHLGVEDQIRAWTSSARELGYRVCAYYNPYIEDRPENPLQAQLQEGKDNGYFLRDAEGEWSDSWLISGSLVTILTIDFTFAEAKAWYQQMLSWAIDLGYSGWMYDFGEYVQPEVLTSSGESGEEHHNRFPVLYHQAAFEHLEASAVAGDWLTFVRSGFTGDQAWSPFVWSGDPAASFEDSDGLPSMVRAGLNLGVSGVPHFGGDINGFHCVADGYAAADEELLIRWIQMGAMSSNMQDQDACNGALDEGEKASIFSSELAQEAWRVWARLHTRLFPYLYSLAWEANESGAPVMRQFFLEHPEDPSLAEVDDAYYLGPALLVAPVLERGARERTLRLPEGTFLDWSSGATLQGGGEVLLQAPLDTLPLLLRDGYLLPLLDPSIDTLAEESSDEVTGPGDVDDVWDVVGFISAETGGAHFSFWDEGSLEVKWTGGLVTSSLPLATSASELADCERCYLLEPLSSGVTRLRLSLPAAQDGAALQLGGLELLSRTGRRTRWDLYLL